MYPTHGGKAGSLGPGAGARGFNRIWDLDGVRGAGSVLHPQAGSRAFRVELSRRPARADPTCSQCEKFFVRLFDFMPGCLLLLVR